MIQFNSGFISLKVSKVKSELKITTNLKVLCKENNEDSMNDHEEYIMNQYPKHRLKHNRPD